MVSYEELPDGCLRLKAPKSLIEKGKKSATFSVWPVQEAVNGDYRPLHAKSVWIWNDNWHVYMIGSSNFTCAGLGLGKGSSNFEANLAYVFRATSSLESAMHKTIPPYDKAVDDFSNVSWETIAEQVGEGAIVGSVLPSSFEEALFEPGEEESFLHLRFGKDAPAEWAIRFNDLLALLFNAAEWRTLNNPSTVRLTWTEKAIPNALEVDWIDKEQQKHTAIWPVNVTDFGQLPPPEALRNLSLETLLEILCSGRPLHEAVSIRQSDGNKGRTGDDIAPELDPLKRFNSETFLLQRTRRVAKAIDQLATSFNRPIVHPDALEWRLRGPVGPCALAKAICKESRTPAEACFLLSEIVLILRRIDASKIALGVDRKEVESAISGTIEEIRSMIDAQRQSGDIPQSMVDYISAALEQV
jgi:hypothetical protein